MEATKSMRRGGLDWNVPREGRASEAYEVAMTTGLLCARVMAHRFDRVPEGWYPNTAARHATRLHVISGLLHRIAERQCNEDLGCPECGSSGIREPEGFTKNDSRHDCRACAGHGSTLGRRLESLRQDAREIAEHYGLSCYFQTDPRGCSLYLVDPAIVPSDMHSLAAYVYGKPGDSVPLKTLQARWIEANYNRGHGITRLGR